MRVEVHGVEELEEGGAFAEVEDAFDFGWQIEFVDQLDQGFLF